MSSVDRRWTDADLERFVDDDQAPEDRAALADSLRTDSALRARLSAIIEVDAVVRAALLGEPDCARVDMGDRRSMPRALAVCAAAIVVIAAVGGWLALRPAAPPISPAPEAQFARQSDHDAGLLAAARSDGLLIAVIPESGQRGRSALAESEAPSNPGERLLALLDAGELDGALAMMRAQPTGAEAESLWQTFGRRLYSGQAAQEVLLSLPEARQVEVCRAWADEPSLRPVTFEWLARLGASEDPAIRAAIVSLRADLHQRPDLRAWLRSYAAAAP